MEKEFFQKKKKIPGSNRSGSGTKILRLFFVTEVQKKCSFT